MTSAPCVFPSSDRLFAYHVRGRPGGLESLPAKPGVHLVDQGKDRVAQVTVGRR